MSSYIPFYKLEVWQLALEIIKKVYDLCALFPDDEKFGLISQIKRAAVSISANIAEGVGRYHSLDKVKFYLNARGSLYEVESHLIVSKELGFVDKEDFLNIGKMMKKLAIKLNNLITNERKNGSRNNG